MRFLSFILIWASLAIGAVAASTAYSWKFPAADGGDAEAFRLGENEEGDPVYAVLAAGAGINADEAEVVGSDTALTPDVVQTLWAESAEPVERVKVKEFSLGRWTHLPHFLGACLGLVAGSLLTRLTAAKAAKAAEAQSDEASGPSPDEAVAALRQVVVDLAERMPLEPDERKACEEITALLGDAIRDYVPAVADQRDRLVARMGLGAFAGMMDVFAASERAMNRAWSAAADQNVDESLDSLERASERLVIVEEKLAGHTPSALSLG